jgi:zinc protease
MQLLRVMRAAAALLLATVFLAPAGRLHAQATDSIAIPYQKFVLDNGLTVLVHEDHKAPIVAVNIWYHVGSKNEKPGRTGFAHLFEHLMFNGSEHYNDDYFKVLEPLGATDLNGTTNEDRTNYFENVPKSALDVVLWMESDRMGFMIGAIDSAKLNEQRGVVQNEKRQGENQPYSEVFTAIPGRTYPAGHPYSWSVIGSMEDLNAASLDDVHEWFKTYYGPSNAVLVIAGDVDMATIKQKVTHYFGAIPAGPPISHPGPWVAKRTGTEREVFEDRVPQARIYMVWNIPEWTSADLRYLDLVSDVLSSGKTSRLYKRLVYDDQIATNVSTFIDAREIGGQFYVMATARPGVDLSKVEQEIDEEMTRFLTDGPTPEELARVKTQFRAGFVRGIERIGGFGGKSDILAQNQVYAGDPDFYRTTLSRVAAATAADLQGAAQRWLADGVYIAEVHPFPQYTVAATDADRSQRPQPGTPPAVSFPAFERATLSNGLKVIVARRTAVPLVNLELLVNSGYAADQFATPGTASFTMAMLDEGTAHRTALQISEQLALLGANLNTGANLDMATVALSSLTGKLDSALDIFADVVLNPAFPEADFQRLKVQRLAQIRQEQAQPIAMALRVLPGLLYGEHHAYGTPMTGTGTADAVQKMTREDLAHFHQSWFKPNNATLIVVGATTMAEIRPKLERLFKDWRPGSVPQKNLATVALPPKSAVYVLDRPQSLQSIILAGQVAPPRANPDEIAIETMNTIFGGAFTSRVNMNLREDKHWSYGAGSLFWDAQGQRPFFVYAPVQTDKTMESMREIAKELHGIAGDHPPTADEMSFAKRTETLSLAGQWETNGAVMGSIAEIVRFGLDDRYYDGYAAKVKALSLSQVQAIARKVLQPDRLVWVVIGDKAKIMAGIEQLGFGPVYEMDATGHVMGQAAGAQ